MQDLFPQLDTDTDTDFADLLEFDLPQDIPGFALEFAQDQAALDTDFIVLPRYPRPTPRMVQYDKAAKLAADLPDLAPETIIHGIVSGNFIFGDFIEALMVEKNYLADKIHIATLSLGKENVDSLRNLIDGDYVRDLSLIVSDFWYAHERRAAGGVPYIEKTLGSPHFHFAAAGIHTKVTLIATACGRRLVLHGSSNLRSSRNVEQFTLEDNPELYTFHLRWMSHLLEKFSITDRSLRGDKLWQQVLEPAKKENSLTGEKAKQQPVAVIPSGNK